MLSGIILAGGLSSRFGRDKTKILFDKKSLLHKTYTLLENHTSQVYISCRSENAPIGYPCIFDREICFAPISGIASSLSELKHSVLVLSCDLPFIDTATLNLLIAQRNIALTNNSELLMTTFQNAENGFIESLVAIYEFTALPQLEKAMQDQNYALHKAILKHQRHHIPYTDTIPFFNINYPQDMEEAQKIIESRK